MKRTFLLIGLALLFQNCKKNKDIGAEKGVYQVEAVFEPYVQAFIAEGAKRGKTIDFSESGLIVEFSNFGLEQASGFCYVGEHHIVIDKGEWNSLSEDVRDYLLFHELGHCVLDRGHRNAKFENNVWRSIMRGSPLMGTEIWIPIPYYGFRKNYFLDELFDEKVNAPSWANQTFDYAEIANNQKEVIATAENVSRLNQQISTAPTAYEIEIDFALIRDRPNRTKLSWGTSAFNYVIEFFPEVGYNVSGYFIRVHKDSKDNGLFYSKNTFNLNGKQLEKITIRREGGFEKIFMNEEFIFHIDELPNPLQFVRMEATTNSGTFDADFGIEEARISAIK